MNLDDAVPYDAVLLVSFGSPERPEDVLPFIENVLRGTRVPRERLLEVAAHYDHFGGVSPASEQIRALLGALIAELNAHGPRLPVYWGNRNWHPLLTDTLAQMAEDGVQRALAFVTSAFGSYSGCRRYLEDIERARLAVGVRKPPLDVDKLRLFYNHPGFIEPLAERVTVALAKVSEARRHAARVVYSAHGIPEAMARRCDYQRQLEEACLLVSERVGLSTSSWSLAYQSRSGPPSQPWLEPSIDDRIGQLAQADGGGDIVIVPIGFLTENMEVVYDLDVQVGALCDELGVHMVRAEVVGSHPRFVRMIRELIVERIDPTADRPSLGTHGPSHDVCPADCCLPR